MKITICLYSAKLSLGTEVCSFPLGRDISGLFINIQAHLTEKVFVTQTVMEKRELKFFL